MANDIAVTPGTGATVATDESAGKHYQLMKLVDGTEDSVARIGGDATFGLDVDVLRVDPGTGSTNLGKAEDTAHSSGAVGVMMLAVRNDAGTALAGTTGDYIPLATDASGNLLTNVAAGAFTLANGTDPLTIGGSSDVLSPSITVSASPVYSVGDVVGGRITLTSALGSKHTGIWQSLKITWLGAVSPALDFIIFDSQPTQNTADNAAFAWNTSDDGKVLWHQPVETTDYYTVPGATVRNIACVQVGAPVLKSSGSADLYLYIVTRTGFTAPSTSSLKVSIGIGKD